jgi:hypothetical protein
MKCGIFRINGILFIDDEGDESFPIRALFLRGLDGFDCDACESGNWESTCSQPDGVLVVELSLMEAFFRFGAPFVSHFLTGGVNEVVCGYATKRNASLICNFIS